MIHALETPRGKRQIEQAIKLLDKDIRRSRFTRARAQQVFLTAVDNCLLWGMLDTIPLDARQQVAHSITEAYIGQRGNIEDQRPARRGWLAVLWGK